MKLLTTNLISGFGKSKVGELFSRLILFESLMSKVSNIYIGDIDAQDTQAVIFDINLNNCK